MPSRTDAHQTYVLNNGTYVPGSTTVIENLGWNKQALMGWIRKECLAGKDPYKTRDAAASIGTVAHALVEERINHALGKKEFAAIDREEYAPKTMETARLAFQGYLDWEEQNNVEYLHSEVQLVSETWAYGGTIDIVAKINGVVYLIDIKTSSGVYPDHIIQVASYHNLFKENFDEDLEVMILHLDKTDGSFSPYFIPRTKIEAGLEVFKNLRRIHALKGKV
jgi:hypothetical protein